MKLIRTCVMLVIAGLLAVSSPVSAVTPEAHPDPEQTPAGTQLLWVVATANGENSLLDLANIDSHFDPAYLESIDSDELLDFAYGLVREYAPVELLELTVSPDGNEALGVLLAREGTRLHLQVHTNPDSGLITLLDVHPESTEATPEASPVANTPLVTWNDIESDYTALQTEVGDVGREFMTAFLADEPDVFESPLVTQELADALTSFPASNLLEMLTTNRVHFEYADVGAIFDGHWSGDTIAGVFNQNGALSFELTATEPQNGEVPVGEFTGQITEIGLDVSVTFSGNLDAVLTIPAQNLSNQSLDNVKLTASQPIGELIDERALLIGGSNNVWRVHHEWGDGTLAFTVGVNADNQVSALNISPQWPMPSQGIEEIVEIQAPFTGAWLTIWGGHTEFLNYHVVAPQQAYALDMVIWNDGATYSGDGLEVEDYYAWGQPYFAPVSGTVVRVVSNHTDIPPLVAMQADPSLAPANPGENPAGNHVVIETEDGLFIYLAHMQQDSAMVEVGDQVEAGQQVGLVGNSGNTSEPHIHIHAQNKLELLDFSAVGIPMYWNDVEINGVPESLAWPEQGDIVELVQE